MNYESILDNQNSSEYRNYRHLTRLTADFIISAFWLRSQTNDKVGVGITRLSNFICVSPSEKLYSVGKRLVHVCIVKTNSSRRF